MSYHVATIVQPGSNNTKIKHGSIESVRSCGISLAASDDSGINVCPKAFPKSRIVKMRADGFTWEDIVEAAKRLNLSTCSIACVTSEAGHGRFDNVRNPRANLTRWYVENREEFKQHCLAELWREHGRLKANQLLACRPNIDSDVPWERTFPEMFDVPCSYWDYTKMSKRLGKTPDNYHLTYSVSDATTTEDWQRVYDTNSPIAVVFDSTWQPGGKAEYRKFGALPTWYTDPNGYRWQVLDGDRSDFRFLDPKRPVCIGLRLKGMTLGKYIARISGFAMQLPRRLRSMLTSTHPAVAA